MPTDRTASGPRPAAPERVGQPDLGELDRAGPQLAQRPQHRPDQDDRGPPADGQRDDRGDAGKDDRCDRLHPGSS